MATAASMDSESSRQLQVRLVSTKEEYAVATTTLSVPTSIDRDGLDRLVHRLLEEEGKGDDLDDLEKISFQARNDMQSWSVPKSWGRNL